MQRDLGKDEYSAPYALIITCAYAGQTIRAAMSSNAEAGRFAANTKYWFGIVTDYQDSRVIAWRVLRENGKKEKTDKLQELIISIVKDNLNMTCPKLWIELKKYERNGVIEEITEDEIYFIGKDGKGGESAPKTGLKDRLSRAKKKLKNK